jgi:glycerol uptake facilitator protein
MTQPPLARALAGEVLETYLLLLFGTGSVAAAVLTKAEMALWQVAVVWGFGVTIAIYVSAAPPYRPRPGHQRGDALVR